MERRGDERLLPKEARNLTERVSRDEPLVFRDDEVEQLLSHVNTGRSVLVVGPPGVGKSAIVREAARRAGPGQTYWELSTTEILRGTRYLGEWQTKIVTLAQEARGHALVISDVWNLLEQGRTVQSSANLFDALRPSLEAREVSVVGEVTPDRLEQLRRVPAFVACFDLIEIEPLDDDAQAAIARAWAGQRAMHLTDEATTALLGLPRRFFPSLPGPGTMFPILDALEGSPHVDRHQVEAAFAEAHGLPRMVVATDEPLALAEVRAWFAERIVGQPRAIDAVVSTIALFKAGLHDPRRPLGTLLFVGPTGVGKTETARALSLWLFGSEARLLRLDLSELKDYHAFMQLVGDPDKPGAAARLLDPVRAHPFQVVLLDELEKAHPNVWDLLLPLLDEGRLTSPSGETVDFRNTIVICTSNVGADKVGRGVGFGARDAQANEHVGKALAEVFRPEFLNRFQQVVPFQPLAIEQLRTVARLELSRVLQREGIAGRGLVVEVDDSVLDLVASTATDPRYGARSLQRAVQQRIALPLALELVARPVSHGAIVRIATREDQVVVRVLSDRGVARPPEAAAFEPARARSAGELEGRLRALPAVELTEASLEAKRSVLLAERDAPGFWRDPPRAAANQSELDELERALRRLRRIEHDKAALAKALVSASARESLDDVARRLRELELLVGAAQREHVWLGSARARADAIVEVRPLAGRGIEARDAIVEVLVAWASHRGFEVTWLRDPEADDEAALLLIAGLRAYGFLALEAGLHRLRASESEGPLRGSVARVRVLPLLDAPSGAPHFTHEVAHGVGHYGSELRSYAELPVPGREPIRLVTPLRFDAIKQLAAELISAFAEARPDPDEIIRRIDREPHFIRDMLTGFSSGRPDALSPESFDRLLALRVDVTAKEGDHDSSSWPFQ